MNDTRPTNETRRSMLVAALSVGVTAHADSATPILSSQPYPHNPLSANIEVSALRADLATLQGAALSGYKPPGESRESNVLVQLNKNIYTSNYSTLQQAHDAVVAKGGGVLWADSNIKADQGFNWEANKVHIRAASPGVVWDFSGMKVANTFAINLVKTSATNQKKTMDGITIVGPPARMGVDCINLHSTATSGVTQYEFRSVTIVDFRVQRVYGNQCSNVQWVCCHFTNSPNNFQTSIGIATNGIMLNSGEALVDTDCQTNNILEYLVNNNGVAGGWTVKGGSMVYMRRWVTLNAPAKVLISAGTHIEGQNFGEPWFTVKKNGATIKLDNLEWWFTGTITAPIFYTQVDTVFGGIFMTGINDYHADGIATPYWIDQSSLGYFYVEHWRHQDSIARMPFGANPGVQAEAWKTSHANFGKTLIASGDDASNVMVDTETIFHEPTTRIATSSIGAKVFRLKRYQIRSGQYIAGSVFLKTKGFSEDKSKFEIKINIYDQNGLLITAGAPYLASVDYPEFTQITLDWYPCAPAGAAFYEICITAGAQRMTGKREIFLAEMIINPL